MKSNARWRLSQSHAGAKYGGFRSTRSVGHEIKKTRPAIVVTNDVYNSHNWVVIVMPLTSRDKAEYDQVLIQPPEGGLTNPSVTLPDQIRAVDRNRVVDRLGTLTPATLKKVEDSLRVVLDL